jgi:uncharacterized protein involved in exopolysaccharide biosynthesis
VLKPIYNFVRTSKQRAGENVDDMRFSDWRKDNLTVKLEKGTSVLNIAYTDTDQSLVLPVIERISSAYQTYSGRDRRRDIANAVAYLRKSIKAVDPKAEASMRRAQAYALSHGLGLNDGMPAAAEKSAGAGGGGSVEASRQQAQARVMLLEQQLAQARSSGGNVLFQAPQIKANDKLYDQYQATEARLSDLRSRLREAMGQRHGIHGTGTGAADAGKAKAPVLQQRVQHAPGEGPVRAPALQRQIQTLWGGGAHGVRGAGPWPLSAAGPLAGSWRPCRARCGRGTRGKSGPRRSSPGRRRAATAAA